eukprot:CAMPEP_0117029074 /NCGR_PEP_ID=MMETSP0472-20121206/21085_1 /TAXON_ID=693140 ORGANISM="Tiarina fusus, Strain LIS" /NCGR_SAMPLE_ID=MMETSP0472 /ASSEMBLY_ACC=CAM_ASM_000603 /LENGTH=224 /DNA_ID=CAMNT_0004736741 /DNA_START=74 /DNA_END=745 /DNA_ORIENTATION=+
MLSTKTPPSDDYVSALIPRTHTRARGPATSFPLKLHQMLAKAEQCGYQDVVSWLPGGKSFKIHKPEGMVSILKTQFNQTKYKSFLRQIQNYGFHRFTRGQRQGECTHKLFVEWDPLMCLQMKRTNKAKADRMSPSMSSMVFQGHCLKTTRVATSFSRAAEQQLGRSLREVGASKQFDGTKASYAIKEAASTNIFNRFKDLPHEQEKLEDDSSWLTTLLEHQDLW